MRAIRFILLMGLVSLLGDIVYEGARSVLGPYFATLGVSALTLGLIVGLSEFMGYGLRLVTGYLVDRSGRYWLATFLGYSMIIAVPLLAFTRDWRVAALLIVLERLGKGIRSPARDTILSFATKNVGRGFGFGIHEALDQVGAFLGPMIMFTVLYLGMSYRSGFTILFIPALLLMIFLGYAWIQIPNPRILEGNGTKTEKIFWPYVLFVFLSVAGFVNFQLLSYNMKVEGLVSDDLIPILYALAMGVDAAFALLIGKLYDKIGFGVLTLIPLFTLLLPLGFSIPLAVLFYGSVMAMHETVMRSAIADITEVKKRGTAYGILNLSYGLGSLLGSSIVGFLYEISMGYVWMYVAVTEFLAILALLPIIRR